MKTFIHFLVTHKITYSLSVQTCLLNSPEIMKQCLSYENQVVGAPSSFNDDYVVCIYVPFNKKRAVLVAVHSGRSCTADSSTCPKQKTHTSINMPQQGEALLQEILTTLKPPVLVSSYHTITHTWKKYAWESVLCDSKWCHIKFSNLFLM